MAFIPHTPAETSQMLAKLGLNTLDDLFGEIPEILKNNLDFAAPAAISEMELSKLLIKRSQQDLFKLCFIGAGAYEHHIPSIIPALLSRGEFLTAYTPYQPEVSQGNLQLLYEYQTMIANLTGMEVANASLYDGASSLAEAILMALRCYKPSEPANNNLPKKILLPISLHPAYRETVRTILNSSDIELCEIPVDSQTGKINIDFLNKLTGPIAALVIQQPNFFGCLEDVHELTDWAHSQGALVIGVVNPTTLSVLVPPGAWGKHGADIACGEAQPLGIPLSSGGPYLGFFSAKKVFIRQMPGRIVGRTKDLDGKPGFVITLQTREQYIRRAKATSNICTNQGLLAAAVAIYLSVMGNAGLSQVARYAHANLDYLINKLQKISGVKLLFKPPFFHEVAISLNQPVDLVINKLAARGIQAGYNLSSAYPEYPNSLLICTTETKSKADLDYFMQNLIEVMAA